jgi:methylated-DNA-[protein]-cysteine S-methyltransferase
MHRRGRLWGSTTGSPVGPLRIETDGERITGIAWHPDGSARIERAADGSDLEIVRRAVAELNEYFSGKRRAFDVPIDPAGTAFQNTVWSRMRAIPYGETVSYADVARAIGKPASARPVGTAVGINPIAVIIPDHRVVTSAGTLSGSDIGMAYRQRIIDFERSVLKRRRAQR